MNEWTICTELHVFEKVLNQLLQNAYQTFWIMSNSHLDIKVHFESLTTNKMWQL